MKIEEVIFVSRILVLILIFCFAAFGQNKNILIIDNPGKSILRMFAGCEYKVVLKNPKNKEVKIYISQIGNGYFAGEHSNNYDYIITANHLLKCDSTIGEIEKSGVLAELDKNNTEDLSIGNLTALKDGKITNFSAYTYENIAVLDIKILYNLPSAKDDSDKALLRGTLDYGVSHNHFPLMEDNLFDEIFYTDGITQKVETRGFLLIDNKWYFRYKNAEIESVWPNVFKINELLDSGLSGSPTTYFHDNILYAIGIVASAPRQETGRILDMSYVTIVKKSFLEQRNKK